MVAFANRISRRPHACRTTKQQNRQYSNTLEASYGTSPSGEIRESSGVLQCLRWSHVCLSSKHGKGPLDAEHTFELARDWGTRDVEGKADRCVQRKDWTLYEAGLILVEPPLMLLGW